jgi:hypothetical protein
LAYWLDYSAAKIQGSTIKNAGYTGVIRYIDSPGLLRVKHTSLDEYRGHLAAGLEVLLVMQTTTTASGGGFATGQDHGRRALAGADHLGYKGPVFFTNDRPDLPNPAAWRSYLDGAASVLGIGRVGAYGFRNAMDAAVGHATYFWQAGRRRDVAPHTHIWQDNNTQVTVGGITCDRNLILKNVSGIGGFLMSLSDQEQRDLFNRIFGMLRQRYYAKDDKGTVVEVDGKHPTATPATVLDSLDGNFLVNRIAELEKRVSDLELAGVDVEKLAKLLGPAVAKAVNDEFARRQTA